MTATNKPMTGAQLDELMAVAMRMQYDSEKMGERSVSMFAYAVQVAVLEIRETRCKYEELQSQNADLAVQLANAESKCRELAAERDIVNGDNAYLRDLVICWARECDRITFAHTNKITDAHQMEAEQELANTYPASSAFLAEVRAQGVEMFAHDVGESEQGNGLMKAIGRRATKLAAQLRKGAAL